MTWKGNEFLFIRSFIQNKIFSEFKKAIEEIYLF